MKKQILSRALFCFLPFIAGDITKTFVGRMIWVWSDVRNKWATCLGVAGILPPPSQISVTTKAEYQ